MTAARKAAQRITSADLGRAVKARKAAQRITAADLSQYMPLKPIADMTLWERRMNICAARKMGFLYSEIAEQFGLSESTVIKDIQLVYREMMTEAVDDMIARQRSILFDFQRANYPSALAGDIDAQKQILSGLDHEARLFGLYAPARVAVGISTSEFAERAVALMESIGTEPPRELMAAAGRDAVDAEFAEEEYPEPGDATPSHRNPYVEAAQVSPNG